MLGCTEKNVMENVWKIKTWQNKRNNNKEIIKAQRQRHK
jgi:hypothetical protein